MTSNFDVKMDEYLPLRNIGVQDAAPGDLKGELEPGERLMEIHWRALGVRRDSDPEAIRKLELEGLVLMIPRKEPRWPGISENNLRDVLEVRQFGALEELAVDLACQRMTEDELEELKKHRNCLPRPSGRETPCGSPRPMKGIMRSFTAVQKMKKLVQI